MNNFTTALELYKLALREVPAYKDFLHDQKFNVKSRIVTPEDFAKIPIIDKRSYITKYPLESIFPGAQFPAVAYASSGSSGHPTYWYRGDAQERMGGDIHEYIFKNVFGIRKHEPTLVIVCFSMGVWVAGSFTLDSCKEVARKGYAITAVTPGIEREDILLILKNIAPRFKHVVVAGYPPFIMDSIREAKRRGIPLSPVPKIITAGDKTSEEWRDAVLRELGTTNPQTVVNIYGSADAIIMGHETPLTIYLRRKARTMPELYRKLFGTVTTMPNIVSYHPEHIFFESVSGELVVTARTGAPLVRYNIHDFGEVVTSDMVRKICREVGLEKEVIALGLGRSPLPMVVLKGRSDVAVTYYALNIYPEHFDASIRNKKISKYLTGSYHAYNTVAKNGATHKLCICLELSPKLSNSALADGTLTKDAILETIVQELTKINAEYRKLYSALGTKANPKVTLYPYGKLANSMRGARGIGIFALAGKKPRIIS